MLNESLQPICTRRIFLEQSICLLCNTMIKLYIFIELIYLFPCSSMQHSPIPSFPFFLTSIKVSQYLCLHTTLKTFHCLFLLSEITHPIRQCVTDLRNVDIGITSWSSLSKRLPRHTTNLGLSTVSVSECLNDIYRIPSCFQIFFECREDAWIEDEILT